MCNFQKRVTCVYDNWPRGVLEGLHYLLMELLHGLTIWIGSTLKVKSR